MDMIADTSSHSLGDALSSPKVMEEDALQVQSPMSSLSLAGPGSICSHSGAASSGDGCEVDSYSSPDSEPHYDAETSKHDFDETTGSNEDHGTKINSPRVVEFSRIREAHPVLQSTGCTAGFCQGGRMIKTNEPRVGRDNVLSEVRTFAFDFLRQLRRDGILPSDEALRLRAQSVSLEIEESSTAVTEREAFRRKRCAGEEDNGKARVGGPWYQTFQELEHGVRLTWKNSPKCIMRSEHQGLQLHDLRHVHSSTEMGEVLMQHFIQAFNGGDIIPSVFVFPPRQTGCRGPMIWNSQLLSFAGYKDDDGSVLGDPSNVALTQAIIELGWEPPLIRTQWDILPLVTMAEGDHPAMTEIPQDSFPLVHITHPDFELQFAKLGLRWVPAPVLSRLGFHIGGVQYTAAPFAGWFMDAEIAVRDLADQQRYNVLPRIVTALGWKQSEHDLHRAPEHERLALLSRAQAELNFAVYHSFTRSGVSMSDTLSASSRYSQFDDEHFRVNGFRLPSNPYWLAPPQGSIIPLWHRGGAPNYQPQPLICRHVRDPIRAWKRENGISLDDDQENEGQKTQSSGSENGPRIHTFYCSAGSTAEKLANELHIFLSKAQDLHFELLSYAPLNNLRQSFPRPGDMLLVIASTAGRGDIPFNGQQFASQLQKIGPLSGVRYAIFGNGSSMYKNTFNGAAYQIQDLLNNAGAESIQGRIHAGDTALQNPPWSQFESWLDGLKEPLGLESSESPHRSRDIRDLKDTTCGTNFLEARLISRRASSKSGIHHIGLEVKDPKTPPLEALSHVDIMVPNDRRCVKEALRALHLDGTEPVRRRLSSSAGPAYTSVQDYLTEYIDLESPFCHTEWTHAVRLPRSQAALLSRTSVRDSLKFLPRDWRAKFDLHSLLEAMPIKSPRTYSTASAPLQTSHRCKLELLIQPRARGMASNFFQTAPLGSNLRLDFKNSAMRHLLEAVDHPLICFATGSGLAPIRGLIGHRAREAGYADETGVARPKPMTLIMGIRKRDIRLIADLLRHPISNGIVDRLIMTPSNSEKARPQDKLFDSSIRESMEELIRAQGAFVFVCASPLAAADFKINLDAIVGCDVRAALGERYIEEIFKPAT